MSKKEATATITSESELNQWLERSRTMLLLFDIHLNWTGRCETMIPQLDALYRSIDQSEGRFKILTLEVPTFAQKFEELVELSPSCTYSIPLKNEENNGNSTATVDDDDNDDDHNPSLKTLLTKSGCSPLFLAVKKHNVLSVVRGANFPALAKIIDDHIPRTSDDDDLDEAI